MGYYVSSTNTFHSTIEDIPNVDWGCRPAFTAHDAEFGYVAIVSSVVVVAPHYRPLGVFVCRDKPSCHPPRFFHCLTRHSLLQYASVGRYPMDPPSFANVSKSQKYYPHSLDVLACPEARASEHSQPFVKGRDRPLRVVWTTPNTSICWPLTSHSTMSYTSLFQKSLLVTIAGSYAETRFVPKNTAGPGGLSTWFGLTPLLFTGFTLWVTTYGMQVGAARRKYIAQAKEDGETDVDERYGLPNLYAQGTSRNAKAFNCVQRSHQHIFENLTHAIVTGFVAAVHYPVMASLSSLTYIVGRVAFSNGYGKSDGDPSQRYSSPLARYMYYGLAVNSFLSFVSCVNMLSGKKLI